MSAHFYCDRCNDRCDDDSGYDWGSVAAPVTLKIRLVRDQHSVRRDLCQSCYRALLDYLSGRPVAALPPRPADPPPLGQRLRLAPRN